MSDAAADNEPSGREAFVMARSLAGRSVVALLAALASGRCTTTTVLSSENPSKERPPQWTDYWSLPVVVHGAVPQLEPSGLAALYPGGTGGQQAGRRVELFINPAQLPTYMELCRRGEAFRPGGQPGGYARVTGALCDGDKVVTYATATILTAGLRPEQLRGHLEIMHLQLWQALTYGNNHPEIVHPGWMGGP